MGTSTALTQSMHHIVKTKRNALSKKQQSYETNEQRVSDAAASQSTNAGKVKVLSDAFENSYYRHTSEHLKLPIFANF